MSSSVQWPDRTLAHSISCTPGVLTSLEILAMDGLLSMPRIGLGVGGLLLGRREQGKIEVLRSVEIPCSHALGPSFILTAAEMKAFVPAPESEEDGPAQIVGWYCSKTQTNLGLTEHDHRLFDFFCPEPWQALLLIHPAKGHPTKAAFGFRQGRQFTPGEWFDLAWQELAGFEKPAAPKPEVAPAPVVPPPPPPPPVPVPIEEKPQVVPVAMPTIGTLFGSPGPESEAPPPRAPKKQKPQRPWKMNLIFAAVLLVVLALLALLARGIFGS
ncbi:MAG TPA: hypothetical protein VGM43_20230 [Bryobacteraceae bacterium]|jgi:hypothetical protein